MKYLIIGLGNIGAQYAQTRHNIGFMVADHLVEVHRADFTLSKHAFKAEFKYKGRQIHVIKPTTYMNLSGKAMRYWLHELSITVDNSLVIVDDLALPFGTLRMRGKGSDAGHNGLKNIQDLIGTSAYPRLRFGIGDNFPKGKQVDYVLDNFPAQERAELPTLIEKSVDMCLSFCSIGIQRTMNEFNK
ncbi:MAG: aminoacyl-tRNA hydrolase [Bernardetiaceae bacterium]|nr:aminoacyl-tRNA hydrolase [Bernardetiaceae bacterium]